MSSRLRFPALGRVGAGAGHHSDNFLIPRCHVCIKNSESKGVSLRLRQHIDDKALEDGAGAPRGDVMREDPGNEENDSKSRCT
jgi:hypothetical protein